MCQYVTYYCMFHGMRNACIKKTNIWHWLWMHSLQMEFLKQMYFFYLHMHTFSCVCTFEGQNYIVRQHSIWFQFALSSGFHQASRSYMFFFTTYMWSFGVWTWFASEGSWCKSCNPEVDGQGPHAALSSTGGTPASEVGYPVVRLSMSVMRLKPLLNRKKTAAYGIPLEGDLDRWINSCNRCSIRIMTIITDQALCTFVLNLCA